MTSNPGKSGWALVNYTAEEKDEDAKVHEGL
jgi:hypothetical protein